ncbi:MAG: hypothetical protein E7633_07840 [Ruminococcaceae bacterium]|nr:hypothetical protein [Oscillospiraceae bacterium]
MKNKKEPWRIVVFVISLLFIIFMWIKNDVVEIYTTMPQEQIVPLIVTTIVVSFLKIGAIVAAVLLIKWIVDKIKNKSK